MSIKSRYFWALSLVVGLIINSASFAKEVATDTLREFVRTEHSLVVGGKERQYLMYIPSSYDKDAKLPLVMSFHGGAGRAAKTADYVGFDDLAEKNGFLVVYPKALKKNWHDGRQWKDTAKGKNAVDDVAFIRGLLANLKRTWAIDESRVYAVGLSNGGMFSQRLAHDLSQELAAVATVIGQLPKNLVADFSPKSNVSILLMNGTQDPFVPFQGGGVTPYINKSFGQLFRKPRGEVISTAETIELWRKHNGLLDSKPEMQEIDEDKDDGTKVRVETWTDEGKSLSVVLYTIVNGGHTLPGTAQYLPEGVIGKTSNDINGSEHIWHFFQQHKKQ